MGDESSPKRSVLVIDDDDLIRRMLARELARAGLDVVSAASLREARRVLESQAIDVVVSDVYMPDADGLETLRYVRSNYPTIRVILISGRFSRDALGQALMMTARKLGAAAVLGKPVGTADLLELIKAVREA